ncbi:MAG TPA: hypothetical protein VJR89_27895, partial [Polyangiales bacterium]|nr:hypothetical protein [Polyangiales bacterium]
RARVAPAWREQCWAIAGLALAAVLANWIATGDHLLRTLARGYWPVAAFDLALLITAAVASCAGLRLHELTHIERVADGEPESGALEVARG